MTTQCRSAFIAAVLLLLSFSAHAQIPNCPDELGDRADSAVKTVTNWQAFASWYHRFGACDDGDTAAMMDTATSRLLGKKWPELMRAGAQFRTHAGLQNFLTRHINAVGLTKAEANALSQRAATNCSSANMELCKAIVRAANETAAENAD